MNKFNSYLEEIKTEILNEYKKSLQNEIEQSLEPLLKEKEALELVVKSKEQSLAYQKKSIQKATDLQQKNQQLERKKLHAISTIWDDAFTRFMNENKTKWYAAMASRIPQSDGTLKYNPKTTPSDTLNTLKTSRPDITFVADLKMTDGFMFESSVVTIDLTRDAFSQTCFDQLKTDIYNQLNTEQII